MLQVLNVSEEKQLNVIGEVEKNLLWNTSQAADEIREWFKKDSETPTPTTTVETTSDSTVVTIPSTTSTTLGGSTAALSAVLAMACVIARFSF